MGSVSTAELRPADVLLYFAADNLAFRGLAWAQRLAGLREAPFGHVGLVSRVDPRGTWADEISAYTDPGRVVLTAKYRWRCQVVRFGGLDVQKAVDFCGRYLNEPYGWSALLLMGLMRRLGFKGWGLPRSCGWERVCSPLIAGALRAGGVEPFPGLHTSLVMPSDFAGAAGGEYLGDWHPEGD